MEIKFGSIAMPPYRPFSLGRLARLTRTALHFFNEACAYLINGVRGIFPRSFGGTEFQASLLTSTQIQEHITHMDISLYSSRPLNLSHALYTTS